ncbi:NAD(P)H-binding protein [Streptomyces sp. NEAU-H3]|uniref:NAD(P)H-binding protein n=1 Tax=Streptomyces sp. NEAU-H3 TaxID=2720636 RepID=UPI00143B29F4|nr:NAD(P)H-binding protein [Streptomyces sp. NEAU-H3]NJA55858.1 NAD(P)H-binding protein [Streptomyces sp. NEAU-H3]
MIVITSPTGRIGRSLLPLLLDEAPARGERLRVVVRDPARLPAGVRDRVEVVVGSHREPDVVDEAFAGADAVFWLVPPDPRTADLDAAYAGFTLAAAGAFARRGVGHVVGVSALGRGTPFARHAGHVTASLAMDDLIAGTGVAYRALANPTFMDNLLPQAARIRDEGVYANVVRADVAAPLVAVRDIAAAAARLLLDRSWSGAGEVPVLGPEDLSAREMAAVMTEVLGRPVRYERQSEADLRAMLGGTGAGAAIVEGFVAMLRAKEAGLDAGVERTPETASPTSFRTWCEEVLEPAVRA